ncbi:unnamed protein product [Lampetra planeri]
MGTRAEPAETDHEMSQRAALFVSISLECQACPSLEPGSRLLEFSLCSLTAPHIAVGLVLLSGAEVFSSALNLCS